MNSQRVVGSCATRSRLNDRSARVLFALITQDSCFLID